MSRKKGIRTKYRGWGVAKRYMTSDTLKTPEFRDAWGQWVESRAKIGKPLSEIAIRNQIRKCERWGHDLAVQSVTDSADAKWQGLFETKGGMTRTPSAGRITAEAGKYERLRPS